MKSKWKLGTVPPPLHRIRTVFILNCNLMPWCVFKNRLWFKNSPNYFYIVSGESSSIRRNKLPKFYANGEIVCDCFCCIADVDIAVIVNEANLAPFFSLNRINKKMYLYFQRAKWLNAVLRLKFIVPSICVCALCSRWSLNSYYVKIWIYIFFYSHKRNQQN